MDDWDSLARQPHRTPPTPGELELWRCLAVGLTLPEAAAVLGRSVNTLKRRRTLGMMRLAAKTSAHAVAICLRNGWL